MGTESTSAYSFHMVAKVTPTSELTAPRATQPVVWQEVIAVDGELSDSIGSTESDVLVRVSSEDADHLMNLVGEHMLTSNQLLQLFPYLLLFSTAKVVYKRLFYT